MPPKINTCHEVYLEAQLRKGNNALPKIKTRHEVYLEDQLRKRLRFDWLILLLGFLLGAIFTAIISVPPLWLGAM